MFLVALLSAGSARKLQLCAQDDGLPVNRAQQHVGTLRGQIVDQQGGAIVDAIVTVVDGDGRQKTTITDGTGHYVFSDLAPGKYTVRAAANGFATYENKAVDIVAGRPQLFNIRLMVMLKGQTITVEDKGHLSLAPHSTASALVLRGPAIDALPNNPTELAAALRALTLRTAGPLGPEIIVNGFKGGRIPPKTSIREIRINENPFSAEYDQLGLSRVEILTKPGTDQFKFGQYFNFGDASLNSRNPFALERAPFQSRRYGGNLSGPILAKRASFFVDFERNEVDNNALINATILDSALNVKPFSLGVLTPERHTTFSPHFDFQLNQKNTLVTSYAHARENSKNSGVGDFSLLSRVYQTKNRQSSLQVTETAVFSPKVVNEIRFQYAREQLRLRGDNSVATISVPEAFTGGGSDLGLSSNRVNRWELQNHTSWELGRHALKAGVHLRRARITDVSSSNFGGTFTFAGRLAPELNAFNQVVHGPDGQPVLVPITTIESYRRTLLFQRLGLTPVEIRSLGGGAAQFSIAGGQLEAAVGQYDLGTFVQDDWRWRPNFMLNWGLRYERQNNIRSNLNFAPRIGFAWSPDASVAEPKTVVRGGFGIFYDRFGENFTLEARRFNGVNQQHYIVSDPTILDLFPNVPSVRSLEAFAVPQTINRVANNLRTPYAMQSSISIERELPYDFSIAATYIHTRGLHMLRSRNINAPLPGTVLPDMPEGGVRPFGNNGEIFQYESSGVLRQNQLMINLSNRFSKRMALWATYTLNKASSDTDGASSFPSNMYDLSNEFGRSQLDVRHNIYSGGWIKTWWGIDLSPLIIFRSGIPFNITTGRDTNGDTLFTERPTFADNGPNVVVTRFGAFDLSPAPGRKVIRRNFGEGPGFFIMNLRASKTFSFGSEKSAEDTTAESQSKPGEGSPVGRYSVGARLGGWLANRQSSITFSIAVQNLLNRVNRGTPIGNLSSPLFGQSYSSAGDFGFGSNPAGNRRIELQIFFEF